MAQALSEATKESTYSRASSIEGELVTDPGQCLDSFVKYFGRQIGPSRGQQQDWLTFQIVAWYLAIHLLLLRVLQTSPLMHDRRDARTSLRLKLERERASKRAAS